MKFGKSALIKFYDMNPWQEDMVRSAEIAQLRYVSDADTGIIRLKRGRGFRYEYNGTSINKKETLSRIRSLVIPPGWKSVWICYHEDGHLQATGLDFKNRKQYRYHSKWNDVRSNTKFLNLVEFGESLPQLRKQIAEDISQTKITQSKVIALVLHLMELTYIRIGNNAYEKENGSYGLTTLKDRHVDLNGSTISFSFKGKKGVSHKISIKNKKLARLVKQCRDIPGKELFQYFDEEGNTQSIDSGMVNNYIRQHTEKPFTAKDFRTWAGTLLAFSQLKDLESPETETQLKTTINGMFDFVSQKLGNSRAVCKKYYVHPMLLDLFSKQSLKEHCEDNKSCKELMSEEEDALLRMLKSSGMRKVKKSA